MKYYNIEMLENVYLDNYPELNADVIREKAKRLHSLLNTLEISWRRSNCRFYHNVVLCSWLDENTISSSENLSKIQ